jgi:hypothetical protein
VHVCRCSIAKDHLGFSLMLQPQPETQFLLTAPLKTLCKMFHLHLTLTPRPIVCPANWSKFHIILLLVSFLVGDEQLDQSRWLDREESNNFIFADAGSTSNIRNNNREMKI